MKKMEKTIHQIIRFRYRIETFFVSIEYFASSSVFRHLREGPNYVLLKCADATFQCRGTLRLKYKQTKLIRKPCCAENGIDGVGIHFVLNRIYLIEW